MRFSIIEFYLEPGISFDVPSKLKGKCSEIINEVMLSTGILSTKPEWSCTLNIIPSKKNKTFYLGPPTVLRKKKDYFYTAFIPLTEVEKVKGDNVSGIYIKYLIQAVSMIYTKEMSIELDGKSKDVMAKKMLIQSKKSPVVKSDGSIDIL